MKKKYKRPTSTVYDYSFHNTSEKNMSLDDVYDRIVKFMQQDPMGSYRLMVGTDSQVHKGCTIFVTGIVIQRMGKGAWACFRKVILPREITSLQEKISMETGFTQEIIAYFDANKQDTFIEIILPHLEKGAEFKMEGHLDIGKGRKNKTSQFVNEMVSRIEAMGVPARIKPFAYVASGYANRHTK